MRNSFVSWLTAATIAFGFLVAGPTAANAESVMRIMRDPMETSPDGWNDRRPDLATVSGAMPHARKRAPRRRQRRAPPARTVRLPRSHGGSRRRQLPRRRRTSAARPRVKASCRLCASQWKEAKAAGTTGGQTWPQFLSQCRTAVQLAASPSGGFAPAPAPAPAPPQAPASQSGSLFPWWQPSAHAPAQMPALLRPCERASTRLSFSRPRPMPVRHQVVWVNTPTGIYHYSGTRYYGHTRRGAYMCEADARAADFARRGIANVRPRRLRAEGAAHGRRRALD